MKRPKGVVKTTVRVSEAEWSGLGKCDPVGARFRRNLDAFWTPDVTCWGTSLVLYKHVICILDNVFEGNPIIEFLSGVTPWVLLGLTFLFWILSLNKQNTKEIH